MASKRWRSLLRGSVLLAGLATLGDCRPAGGDRGLELRASAGRRIALVVGNQSYLNFGRLTNPVSDARLMYRTLQDLGFDVTFVEDAGVDQLRGAVNLFSRSVRAGDIALVYYSGHGVSVGGHNYLVPVDFQGTCGTELAQQMVERAFSVDQMLACLRDRGSRNVLLFDACRNNPCAERARSLTRDLGATRAVGEGLARVTAPPDTVIVYATDPGNTADDAPEDTNSPFARAFARHVRAAVDISEVVRSVRREVRARTGMRQTPWSEESLDRSLVLGVDPSSQTVAAVPPSPVPLAADPPRRDPEPSPVVATVASVPVPPTCTGGRLWNAGANRCECPASTPNFNTSTQQCVGTCYPGSSWNASRNGCDCEAGLVWNASAQRCSTRTVASASVAQNPSVNSAPVASPPTHPSTSTFGIGSTVGPTWAASGTDDVAQSMTLRARQFAVSLIAVTDMMRTRLREGREGISVPGTMGPGFCYRVIGVGDTRLRDLDMFLLDTQGRQIDADRAPDNYPVIGLNRSLCVPPGAPPIVVQLRVRSFSGSGEIGVQIFAYPYDGSRANPP